MGETWIDLAVYCGALIAVGVVLGAILATQDTGPFLAVGTLVTHGGRYARIVSGTARHSRIGYIGSDEVVRVRNRSLARPAPFCCEVCIDGDKITRLSGPEPWHALAAVHVRDVTGHQPYTALYRLGGAHYLVAR